MMTKFMARSSSPLGKVRTMAMRPTGIIIDAAMPCGTRAAINIVALMARPHSSDETVNSANANKKMRRVPKRSASQPLTGMKTARLRM